MKAPADTPGVVLFEEMVHTYEDAHRSQHLYRQIYRILTPQGVEGWDSLSSGWSPWYEDKPMLRARIVAPGGRAFMLDPKTIETSGLSGGDQAVYSDQQMVRAPLPGVAVGAVVEVEISWVERAPLFEAGTTHRFSFGGTVPVQKARLEIDKPLSMHVEHVVRHMPTIMQTMTIHNDRSNETYESGPIAPRPEEVPGQPARRAPARVRRLHDRRLLGDGGGGVCRHRRSPDREARLDGLRARRQEGARSQARSRRHHGTAGGPPRR